MVIVLTTPMNNTSAEDTDGDGYIDSTTGSSVSSKSDWNCNITISNPTLSNKYSSTLSFSLKTTLGGSLDSFVYFKLKSGDYIDFNRLFPYLLTHDFTFQTYFRMSWSGHGNMYDIDFCGFWPWTGNLSGTSFSKTTDHVINDFASGMFYLDGYKNTSITSTFRNLTINGNQYPIIIIDKIKVTDTDQFFWVNNRCYAFSPGMTWSDFIDNSSYDKERLFSKYTAENMIKYSGCLESGTYYIKDQVLSDTIQATTYELINTTN